MCDLTARIHAVLDGPLAPYASKAHGKRQEWPLVQLCEQVQLTAVVRAWGDRVGYYDERVRLTQWNKYFWRAVLPPWVLAAWLGGTLMPASAVLVNRGHEPAALHFIASGGSPGHPAVVFAPWVEAMAVVGRMSPRVIWSNAGNLLEALLGALPGFDPALAEQAVFLRRSWIEQQRLESGRNPLFQPIRWVPGTPPRRVRRICCLRYREPSLGYCATCPLEAVPDSAATSRSASRAADNGPPKNQVSKGKM